MAAMPPSVWPIWPVPAQRARSTPQEPLAASSASTASPCFQPSVRRTFVAPMLPLPCWRMSRIPAERATSRPLGIDPTRYAAMRKATYFKLGHASADLRRAALRQVRRGRLAPGKHVLNERARAGRLVRNLAGRPAMQPTHLLGQLLDIPESIVRAEQEQVGPPPEYILEVHRHLGLNRTAHLRQSPRSSRSDLGGAGVVVAQHAAECTPVPVDNSLDLFGRLVCLAGKMGNQVQRRWLLRSARQGGHAARAAACPACRWEHLVDDMGGHGTERGELAARHRHHAFRSMRQLVIARRRRRVGSVRRNEWPQPCPGPYHLLRTN